MRRFGDFRDTNCDEPIAFVASCGYIVSMTTMGVREFKNRLSECINMVREGGEVYVTHRGNVVAELRSPSSAPSDGSSAELRRLARAGKVRLGAANRPGAYAPTQPVLTLDSILELLDETRGE